MAEARIQFHRALLHGHESTARQLAQSRFASENLPEDVSVRLTILDATADTPPTRQLAELYYRLKSDASRFAVMRFLNQRGKGHWVFGSWSATLRNDPQSLPALCGELEQSTPCWGLAHQHAAIALDLVEKGEPLSLHILTRMPGANRMATNAVSTALAANLLKSLSISIATNSPAVQGLSAEGLDGLKASLNYHAGDLRPAIDGYGRMVSNRTLRASVYYRLARLDESRGDRKAAADIVELGLRNCASDNPLLLALSAEQRAACGDNEGALRCSRRCLELSPANPLACFALSEAEFSRGRRDAAILACADGLACSNGWGVEVLRYGERVVKRLGIPHE